MIPLSLKPPARWQPSPPAPSPQAEKPPATALEVTPLAASLPVAPQATLPTVEQGFLLDLAAGLAKGEKGADTPFTRLHATMQKTHEETGSWTHVTTYKEDLIRLLTPNLLGSSDAYLKAYRLALKKYPSCGLSGQTTLSSATGAGIPVDTLLLRALSSVVNAAFSSNEFQETAQQRYASAILDEASLNAVARFISHGYVGSIGSPLSLQESLDLYEAAHALEIGSLCQLVACQLLESMGAEGSPESVNAVWKFAEEAHDPLTFCCVAWTTLQSAPGQLEGIDNRLQGLHAAYSQLTASHKLEISADAIGWATVLHLDAETAAFCRKAGIDSIACTGTFDNLYENRQHLKGFKAVDLRYIELTFPQFPVRQEQFRQLLSALTEANTRLTWLTAPRLSEAFIPCSLKPYNGVLLWLSRFQQMDAFFRNADLRNQAESGLESSRSRKKDLCGRPGSRLLCRACTPIFSEPGWVHSKPL